ncbi:hypothetical protein ABDK00_015680 [Niabella insulamsoli]|uniref:hypothetical protein n=1 Tax=Niabella insulamsoli TaxID=3144874 RepID=UPI0031FC865E
MKKRLIQIASIFSFICLISLFLAYRSGKFDYLLFADEHALQSSPNGAPVTSPAPMKNESPKKMLLPSSKSMVVAGPTFLQKDSFTKPAIDASLRSRKYPVRKKKPVNRSLRQADQLRLSSSKSILIVTPNDSAKKRN